MECITSFSCGAMYEVSHVGSQITVRHVPCLLSCVRSLKDIRDLLAGIVILISLSIVTVILLRGILYCLHVVIIVNGLFRVALLCPVV